MEWISVDERLPENDESVLGCAVGCDDGIDICSCENGVWRDNHCNPYTEYPITHWMPLPEPPPK